MTDKPRIRNRQLDEALARFLDDEPEPADGPALADAMQSDPAFAAEVQRLLITDDLLRQNAELDAEAFVDAFALRTGESTATDLAARLESAMSPAGKSAARFAWLPWAVASIAIAIAVAALVVEAPDPLPTPALGTNPAPQERSAEAAAIPRVNDAGRPVVALLVNEVDARFAEGAAPDAVRFGPGDYELTDGAVHLRFSSGADVVIPSPARFSVRDPLHMTLTSGSLRALVSPSAQGFTVDAPGIRYEDLGTEFGVAVRQDRSQSELHVFEGTVNVRSLDGRMLSSLTLGESARVIAGEIGPAPPPDLALYPTPDDVGLLRWRRWREQVRADRSLVCYYSFDKQPDDATLLKDEVGLLDGRILGARWVTGRWPGKQALLFDQRGDGVALSLPDAYRQLTVAGWIRVERLDFGINSFFDSDGWGHGDLHLQLNRAAQPWVGIYGNNNEAKDPDHPVPSTVPVGRWVHVAAVIDLDRHWCGFYVDGALADTTPITVPDLVLVPGACRIGDWVQRPDWNDVPERGFRGRIDEFAIWSRALSQTEIQAHVEAGRPSLLASVATAPSRKAD